MSEPVLASGIITKVERQARAQNRYNLYINDQYAFSVHEDVLIKYRLFKGEEIEKEQYEAIVLEEERQKAYLNAVRLLSSRLRTEHEIKTRLKQKSFSEEIVQETVERLKTEGYLNDSMFADQLTRQRLHSQKKGRHFIKQELQQKGVSKERIQTAISQVDEETEFQMAYELASKKYRNELKTEDPLKTRRKIAGFLARRGYPGGVVTRVLRQLPIEAAGEEEEWTEWDES
ncbi:RecX family transcriptional regulator [Paenibacillus sp. GD4]|uniref:RecX family transcriptional regulator n=1 Tax=Paenibacillus sp. GD4 TaxID=3068890 RepID=UPI002796B803|nr:RecX family transcriptional regulator [Paenibacillus sp. GD4]MDQ1908911.1 RecX family transcriptional regulator [Paenibacillus sp. GD4]